MLDRLYRFVGRLVKWPVVVVLFIAFVLLMLGFRARSNRLGSNPPMLDVRYWYTPTDVKALFDKLGADGRGLYALSEVTLDLAFPFVYGGILLILIHRLFGPKAARLLLLIPLLGMGADLLENAGIATMAATYTGDAPKLASVVTVFSLIKGVLIRVALVVVLIGGVRALVLRHTGEDRQEDEVWDVKTAPK